MKELWTCTECDVVFLNPSKLRVSDNPESEDFKKYVFICPVCKFWSEVKMI